MYSCSPLNESEAGVDLVLIETCQPFLCSVLMLIIGNLHKSSEVSIKIWSPKSVTMIKRIEGVQRRATKLMLPNLSYNERLKRLDLLPLVNRREVKDLSTFYKLKSGNFNCSFNSYFKFCSDERLRSHASNKLKINRVRTEHFKGTFFNRIPYLWNNLPDALRTTNCSVFSFKRLCTIFYKDRVFDPDYPNVTWA